MTKDRQHLNSGSVARQSFFVPHRAPFLEVRTTLDSTLPYAEHVHSAFSLGLILQGKTLFTLGGAKYLAEEGDIALIAPGCAHSCNPVGGPRGYYMLLIDAAWLRERMGEELLLCSPLIKDVALSSKAGAVMEAILTDQKNAANMLTELLLELRARHTHVDKGIETHPHQWPDLNDGGDATHANGVPLSVTALARAAGMRRESFSRAVRRTTGLPPRRHLQCLQLEKARSLLRQGKSIIEAALAAGYTDQSHFHRVFLKFCAVTPGRYKRGMSQSYKK